MELPKTGIDYIHLVDLGGGEKCRWVQGTIAGEMIPSGVMPIIWKLKILKRQLQNWKRSLWNSQRLICALKRSGGVATVPWCRII